VISAEELLAATPAPAVADLLANDLRRLRLCLQGLWFTLAPKAPGLA
jgi:hypothetical protein